MLQLARVVRRTPLALFPQFVVDDVLQQQHDRGFYDSELFSVEAAICGVEPRVGRGGTQIL